MYEMQQRLGYEWNNEKIKKNYIDKENYSIYRNEIFVGFLSLEIIENGIFIHTLQVEPKYQNRFVGYNAYLFLCGKARNIELRSLVCCVFENNTIALEIYSCLGFIEVSREKGILRLELNLVN